MARRPLRPRALALAAGVLLAAPLAGRRRRPWPRAFVGEADAGWSRGWREDAAAAAAAGLHLEAPDKSPLGLDLPPEGPGPADRLRAALSALQASRACAAARAAGVAARRALQPLAGLCAELLRRVWDHEEVFVLRARLAPVVRRATPTRRDLVAAGVGAGATAGLLVDLGQGDAFKQAALVLGRRCGGALRAGARLAAGTIAAPFDAARHTCGVVCDAAGAVLFVIVAPAAMCAEVLRGPAEGLLDAWDSQELRHLRFELAEFARAAAPTKRDILATGLGLGAAVWLLDIRGGGGQRNAASELEAAAEPPVDDDAEGRTDGPRHQDSHGGYFLLVMFAGCASFLAAFYCWIRTQDAR